MPINPGHTLIVPRRHATYLADLEPDEGAAMFRAGQRIAAAIRASSLRCDAVNLLLNDGAEAGQRVFHTHLHVIPRVLGDSLHRDLNALMPLRTDLDAIASEIATHL
jgi:diadenosine tetraphosphate (Ap4A) HIT family hydrolase